MTKTDISKPISFQDALEERYLSYALSTIKSRSLPDVRDGLKPVHRRLLYAMLQLNLDPKSGFKKCARVVGDVIGKYHPHGEVAVYDAMVRMAQEFSSRYPLVEGQGNFGSIDGDSQAAMRYTEARLTPYALFMLEGIDEDAVDFRPTYDSSESEPVVLPAMIPNLLANGTEGIAVGMATSIPPHNIIELLDALLALLSNPSIEDLTPYVLGPDFPTGGVMLESSESMAASYAVGRGAFRLRGKWHLENLEFGQYQIVITEIPYQVTKRNIIEQMAALFTEKKLPLVETFQDMSAEEISIVITPRSRNINPEALMETLFKLTDLEVKFHLNMNVLSAGQVPMVMSLKRVLLDFIEHRSEVTVRRSQHRLNHIGKRLHLLDGLLITYLNLDEIINIIRHNDEPKPILMMRWNLSDEQAEAVLNMRLRSLKKLEEITIRGEHQKLTVEQQHLQQLLSTPSLLRKNIMTELQQVRKKILTFPESARRTTFGVQPEIVPEQELQMEKEPITVILSHMGWLRASKGHNGSEIKYKDGDSERFVLMANATDKLLLFSNYGKCYTIPCTKIGRAKGWGDPLRLIVELTEDEEIISAYIYQPNQCFLLASSDGHGLRVEANDVLASTKHGKQLLNCPQGSAIICSELSGDMLAVLGENHKLLIFPISEVPILKRGRGVTLMKFKKGSMKDIMIFNQEEGLTWVDPAGGEAKRLERHGKWQGRRGGFGLLVLSRIWTE